MRKIFGILVCLALLGCDENDDHSQADSSNAQVAKLKVTQKITQVYSETDNVESVRAIIDGSHVPSAIVVSSKSRTVREIRVNGNNIVQNTEFRDINSDGDDEFTNSAVLNEGVYLLTKTILTRENDKIVDCGGELYVAREGEAVSVPVGAMPDAVAVTPDKRYAVTADERDSESEAWGKCPVASVMPSVTFVALGEDVAQSEVVKSVQFTKNALGPREPEYVAVSSDNETVAVTLQDSHEIAILKISELMTAEDKVLDESVAKIVQLPANAAGANPWPDGVVAFDVDDKTYFAIAGEWNDTLIIVDTAGNVVSNTMITEREVPTSYPCIEDNESPRYSPDSVTSFEACDKVYVAATLRFAGAVIIYDVTNPAVPAFAHIESVGESDVTGCSKEGSKVYPEGISSGNQYIWTANEGENSVTVFKIEC